MRTYGWKPDLPDVRDHTFMAPVGSRALPLSVDLRSQCSPVEDQGDLGSCTGNAIAGALEFLAIKRGAPRDFSRLFIYYGERVIEHTTHQDAGAMIRDGIKVCKNTGVCDENLWPYVTSEFARKPPAAAYADAAQHKITSYARVLGLTALRASLAQGVPVVFGFSVYESFESDDVANTGIVPMPSPNERLLGGHAVLAVGYDHPRSMILVRNSWGTGWGLKGYCWMPYGYITDRNLSDDFWRINA